MDDIRRGFYDDDEEFVALDEPAAGSSKAAAPQPPAKRKRNDNNNEAQRSRPPPAPALPAVDVDMDHDNDRELAMILGQDSDESEFQQLIRAWQNERHSPVILQFQEALLGRVLDEIRRQSNDVNVLRGDNNLSEEDHYMMMLVQTEIERVRFVVRSYVRTRLHKIEQHADYICAHQEIHTLLSASELRHAKDFRRLVEQQLRTAVLDYLPNSQQGLDDQISIMPPMISEPEFERPVFVHARVECGPILLPDGNRYPLEKGSINLLRYRTVEHLLARGEVELV